jgi:uncharacterized protein involved in type VI secretion and phage assembly
VTTFVGVMSEVARRELATHRSLSLGVVTESFTNSGGSGEHHLDCNVRLHGSGLVLQHVPVAVTRPGLSAVPRVGDLVVVGFLDGEINGPVLLGALHADGIPSPDAEPDEVVYEVPDAGGSARRVQLRLPNGNTVTVTDEEVTIDFGGTKVLVENGGGITLEASGDITITAGGNLKLEANANVEIKAMANFEAKASANATVQGSAAATLKGAVTTIAGLTSFSAG